MESCLFFNFLWNQEYLEVSRGTFSDSWNNLKEPITNAKEPTFLYEYMEFSIYSIC